MTGTLLRFSSRERSALQTCLFGITLFVSAGLLFFVEPMFAKMVLPRLGGSPAVWNTCVVFFQAAMLGGYAYAHLTTSWLTGRQQTALHIALLALMAFSLPVNIPADWLPPSDSTPLPWLLSVLVITVGGPFFLTSATAPLLQKWFSRTDHPSAGDPYFLYAASNIGSVLALVAYPFLVEPRWTFSRQSAVWAAGYGLLAVMVAACGGLAFKQSHARSWQAFAPAAARPATRGITWSDRWTWIALSAVPSSLMLAVTTHISTDIAAMPLLWILPLGLYLLSFVLGFARTPAMIFGPLGRVMPLVILVLVLSMIAGITGPTWLVLPIHLAAFFVCTMVLHRRLALCRPGTNELTAFYFWIAFGGVLGSAFNTFAAPLVFTGVLEYPLALVLACMLRPQRIAPHGTAPSRWRAHAAALGAVELGTAGIAWGLQQQPANFNVVVPACAVMVVFYAVLSARWLQFGRCTGAPAYERGLAALSVPGRSTGSAPLEPAPRAATRPGGSRRRRRALTALVQLHRLTTTDSPASSSEWLVMAGTPNVLGSLRADARWQPPARGKTRVWTDDYSDQLAAIRLQ